MQFLHITARFQAYTCCISDGSDKKFQYISELPQYSCSVYGVLICVKVCFFNQNIMF